VKVLKPKSFRCDPYQLQQTTSLIRSARFVVIGCKNDFDLVGQEGQSHNQAAEDTVIHSLAVDIATHILLEGDTVSHIPGVVLAVGIANRNLGEGHNLGEVHLGVDILGEVQLEEVHLEEVHLCTQIACWKKRERVVVN